MLGRKASKCLLLLPVVITWISAKGKKGSFHDWYGLLVQAEFYLK
jgi:hypothetical protein